MTPEQRERAFEQMNPQQQDNARKLVQWFDALPKGQQTIQLQRLERFEQLPPEQRAEVRGLLKEAQDLPPDRRLQVRQALARLQNLPDADRDRFLNSPAFKTRFSAEEQRVITRLADAWLPPF
jgi:thioesterase domain-containing protein